MKLDAGTLSLLLGLALTLWNIVDRIKGTGKQDANVVNTLEVLKAGNATIQNTLAQITQNQTKFNNKLIRLEERYKSNTHRLNAIDGKGGPEDLEE